MGEKRVSIISIMALLLEGCNLWGYLVTLWRGLLIFGHCQGDSLVERDTSLQIE